MLARWAWRCHTPDPIKSTTSTKAFGKKLEENKSSSFKKIDIEATNDVGLNSRDNGKEGGILEEEKTCRRSRGREDTGVASLLVAIAEDDPLGETIRCLQRWACDAILLEEVLCFLGLGLGLLFIFCSHSLYYSGLLGLVYFHYLRASNGMSVCFGNLPFSQVSESSQFAAFNGRNEVRLIPNKAFLSTRLLP